MQQKYEFEKRNFHRVGGGGGLVGRIFVIGGTNFFNYLYRIHYRDYGGE